MRAFVCDGPGSVVLTTVPDPAVREPTDVILRVRATTICGSDIHLVEGHIPTEWGFVLGHEYVGEVVETGSAVRNVVVGDRVVGPAAPWCGSCRHCRLGHVQRCPRGGIFGSGRAWGDLGGGHSELLRVPWADTVLSRVPDNVTDKQALTVGDILSTGWTVVRETVRGPGRCLLVLGCGPIGLSVVHAATMYGQREIIAVDGIAARRTLASQMGATRTLDPTDDLAEAVREATDGRGADGIVDAVGVADTVRRAAALVALDGRIGLVGIPNGAVELPLADLLFKNVSLWTGLGKLDRMDRLLELIADGVLDPSPVFTHERPFDEMAQAYREFEQREDGVVKTLISVSPA